MAEPTYEELKARIEELEQQGAGRRSGELVSSNLGSEKKAGLACTASAASR